ncbi:hypothetical protein QMY54_00332 (plasmid) [Pseudomonas rhodesiae]|nr:hypothetical protein QMY54_00332 [Pseudomonas rhodesiae]
MLKIANGMSLLLLRLNNLILAQRKQRAKAISVALRSKASRFQH